MPQELSLLKKKITKQDITLLENPTAKVLSGAMSLTAMQLHTPKLIPPSIAYYLAYVITGREYRDNDTEMKAFVDRNQKILTDYANKIGIVAIQEMSIRNETLGQPTEELLAAVKKTYEQFKGVYADMFNRVKLFIACYLTGMTVAEGAKIDLASGLVSNYPQAMQLNKYVIENNEFLTFQAKRLLSFVNDN